ncbi:DUF1700 domain-containing protein [Blautia sp. HCP3S3_H10_1]|uniref:DUF1700 domain-containing protein n=1 Tax=unclassified Blautia TaxID=2648079 RepID=UPI003F8EF202
MDRAQFMKQLERLLSDISEAERQEALAYYNSYFDEAGPENEASVIRELGSPGKVAAIIKADLEEQDDGYARYTEHGYEDMREEREAFMPELRGKSGREKSEEQTNRDTCDHGQSGSSRKGYHPKEKGSNSRFILILIALVFLSPLIVGASSGLLGVLVILLFLPFLSIFAVGAIAFGLVAGAIACLAVGVGLFATSGAVALLVLGIGCLLLAAGILCWMFVFWMASKIFPWVLRKVTDFFQRILYRNKKEDRA